ncbi:MAG TPA: recombinase family protein [Clostridiaceae bacterium]|nr:recombinase family protein [Clostridiaceae bacterium]
MKGVIYARYSSEKQTEQSIEGQIRVCEEYCKRNDIDIVHIYVDRAVSASKNIENRVEFLQMIKDSEKQKWECVIVYKLDRFARNRYDSAIYKNKLKKNGIRLISATENISDSPEGIILESVLEGMAEFYSKELSQKVTRGMYESALKAQSTGGAIPMGYKVVNKKLEIDPIYAPIIKEAFEMYANGFTVKQICDKLNAAGYKTKRGKRFTHSSFNTVFSNKKYIGIYTYNNEVEIEGGIPALIDKETFFRVQEKLKRNKKAPARGKSKVDYLLTGKLFCGHCERSMVGESAKKPNKRYHYYTCNGRKKFRDCDKNNIQKEAIERLIVENTVKKVLTEENINLIANIALKELEKDKNDNALIKALGAQINEIQKGIDGLLKAFEMGAVSESLTKRLNKLEQQKKDTEIRLIKEQKSYPTLEKEHIIFWLEQFKDGDIDDPGFQRHIIDLLINKVFVFDVQDGIKLIITYNLTKETPTEIHLSDLKSSDMSNFGPPNKKRLSKFNLKVSFTILLPKK